MSQNFGLEEFSRTVVGGVVNSPQRFGNTGTSNPTQGPVGSIYQPSSFFPLNNNNGKISMAPPPPASNFGSQSFPRQLWNTVAKLGNPLNIFRPNNAAL